MNWQIQHNHQKHQLGTRLFPQKVFQASSDDGQEKSHTTIILKSKGSLDDLVLIRTVDSNTQFGSVALKCKKKLHFEANFFFCLKLPNSSRKLIKKILHFKIFTF